MMAGDLLTGPLPVNIDSRSAECELYDAAISKSRERPPRGTLLLNSRKASTRERESPRGLRSVAREEP